MTDPFLEKKSHVENVRERLRNDMDELRVATRRYDEVAAVLHRIGTPYVPMAAFGGSDEVRTMLVRDMRHKGRQLLQVAPLIVPGIVRPCRWQKPHPNDHGTVTMSAEDVPVTEIVDTLIGLYADGVVTVGTLDDAVRPECPKCGDRGWLVCEHWLDHDAGCQHVTVRQLCLACPQVKDLADDPRPLHHDHPLLPPRVGHGTRRPDPH